MNHNTTDADEAVPALQVSRTGHDHSLPCSLRNRLRPVAHVRFIESWKPFERKFGFAFPTQTNRCGEEMDPKSPG
jgi:hypothetical protein